MEIGRRELLKAAGGLAIFAGLSSRPGLAAPLRGYPFTLGVASGDPTADGFVLWTRLAPQPLEFGCGMPMRSQPVGWEVAEDERFQRIVKTGTAVAPPELGHSVHVEVEGLKPERRYWYRFTAGGEASMTGTVRTAPAAGAKPERVRIAVAGCQHYEMGRFTAFRHLAQEDELDAVFHYGDYIYEGSSVVAPDDKRRRVRHHVGDEIYSLDDYRRRYALYKSDPDLQAAHAAAAFLPSWDDHEMDNNWAGIHDQDGSPPELFLLRRFAAMQAWYENMPVRRAQFPSSGRLQMFRRLDYGGLLRIHVLDTRQHRSDQRCGPKDRKTCRAADDAAPETMLGSEQEAWLAHGLDRGPRWHLLAQQVMVMPMRYPESRAQGPVNFDSWSGYPAARQRLVDAVAERGLTNVVIATGDVHKHHAGVVPRREGALDGPAVATEFVATSISSGGDGDVLAPGWDGMAAANPHCRLFNAQRGYQLFDIRRDRWDTDARVVDRVTAPGGRLSTVARFSVVPERAGLHER